MPLDELFRFDPAMRSSYASVESDEEAWVEVQRLVSQNYLRDFATLEECKSFLGGDAPVVSKFGMITKEKVLPNGTTKVKRRLILDSKESGVSAGSAHPQRIVLPDLTDLVRNVVDVTLASCDPPQVAILDFVDAFWNLGLYPSERKYFVGKLRGHYFVFLRLAQGSRTAPLVWCRFAALVARLAQSLFRSSELRLHVYVDDPAIVLGGPSRRKGAIWQFSLPPGCHSTCASRSPRLNSATKWNGSEHN